VFCLVGLAVPFVASEGSGTASAVRYYTMAGLAVAMRTGDQPGQTTTLAPDWQNTVRHQIDNQTGELRTSLQTPYGAERGQMPAGWAGERGFVGGVKDATGLTRIGARDYDPVLERFVTVDPLQDLSDPLQWNAYLYANNTPVTRSDPTGMRPPPPPGGGSPGFSFTTGLERLYEGRTPGSLGGKGSFLPYQTSFRDYHWNIFGSLTNKAFWDSVRQWACRPG
jgi:RHS repeat-associated protein